MLLKKIESYISQHESQKEVYYEYYAEIYSQTILLTLNVGQTSDFFSDSHKISGVVLASF